jgi:hypothetical protein
METLKTNSSLIRIEKKTLEKNGKRVLNLRPKSQPGMKATTKIPKPNLSIVMIPQE